MHTRLCYYRLSFVEGVVCFSDLFRLCGFCFFFQAEDGIRDLVRSRGLGVVYKRQPEVHGKCTHIELPKGVVSYDDRRKIRVRAIGIDFLSLIHI